MKKLIFAVLVTGLVIAGSLPSNAGRPIDRTLTCPIGGETYVVPGTLSCTNLGQYFDMRQITSCEWVKWPPICPSNGFPVFKQDFSDAEIAHFTALGKIIKAKNSQPQPVPEQRQTAGKYRNLSPEVPCPTGTIEDMSTGQCTR